MSGSFIIRIRSSEGTARFTFTSGLSTLEELQTSIENKYNVPIDQQILSLQPPSSSPEFIEAPPTATFSDLGWKHGEMIYLVMGDNHVSRIRREEAATRKPKKKMAVTMETSDWVNDPRHKEVDLGPKHIPFMEFIEARQKQYAGQPWNIDPPKFSYQSVPYTGGRVRFTEVPPNAVVKRQEYRHCDSIVFRDAAHLGRFKTLWEQTGCATQRAAHLLGDYEIVDDHQREGKKRLQANVYCLYVPPHTNHPDGVKFLPDPNDERMDALIEACGMERVGWCITTQEREPEEKYHGPIFMTGQEIFTACRFQTKYRNENTGYSRFISLIVHPGMKEPEAYMISDQGVAMVRDGLITFDEGDPGFMQVRSHPKGMYVPGVISENSEIPQGGTFLPDALLVNVVASAATVTEAKFQFMDFPENGTEVELREHLRRHRDKELHVIFSDFNLIKFLPNVLPLDMVCQIARAVVNKERLPQDFRDDIHNRLQRFRM